MSFWTRIANVARTGRLNQEFDEEMRAHFEEAVEHGRDPLEARRSFGPVLRHREASRDAKVAVWLESLWTDCRYGWRQLLKNKAVSAAAILSLALATGACTSVFRLVDAVLWRPLPIASPERLHAIERESLYEGRAVRATSFAYPMFRMLRDAAEAQAVLLAISYAAKVDVTYGGEDDIESAHRQYVSGTMFGAFGLRPALGRLLTESDDRAPGAHPYAVISHNYWTRRFGQDAGVLGQRFRIGETGFEIVGVTPEGFTGTETGVMTDIFIPTMMNTAVVNKPDVGWFRLFAMLHPGVTADGLREVLQPPFRHSLQEEAKAWPAGQRQAHAGKTLLVAPASNGVSGLQRTYERPLAILALVAFLVLSIACANVANLMTAQSASRAREMALRVSIGAGRGRLVQLVLIESACTGVLASLLGAALAWWSSPFVLSMIGDPQNPVQLALPVDWRLLVSGAVLAMGVTIVSGLAPALRASGTRPVTVLRGGSGQSASRSLHPLIAGQTAFCFAVILVAGLFASTFGNLSRQPTGLRADGVLLLEVNAKAPQRPEAWNAVLRLIRSKDGVESAATSPWALLTGSDWSQPVFLKGRREPAARSPYFLSVSPDWMRTMGVTMIAGRDFHSTGRWQDAAIITETAARMYFDGQNPVGKTFERLTDDGKRVAVQVAGMVRDVRYRNLRDAIEPVFFLPYPVADEQGRDPMSSVFAVRVTPGRDTRQLTQLLRHGIAGLGMRVATVRTHDEVVRLNLVRERLLAGLSTFFASVALLLGGVGFYGVLNYSLLQRRREIGVRMALGAQMVDVVREVTAGSFAMVALGSALGVAGGFACARFIESLLYGVGSMEPATFLLPACALLITALAAALPPVARAIRIDPSSLLRAE